VAVILANGRGLLDRLRVDPAERPRCQGIDFNEWPALGRLEIKELLFWFSVLGLWSSSLLTVVQVPDVSVHLLLQLVLLETHWDWASGSGPSSLSQRPRR